MVRRKAALVIEGEDNKRAIIEFEYEGSITLSTPGPYGERGHIGIDALSHISGAAEYFKASEEDMGHSRNGGRATATEASAIYARARLERERQIKHYGYTPEHDKEVGLEHLLREVDYQLVVAGDIVKALAVIDAIRDLGNKAPEKPAPVKPHHQSFQWNLEGEAEYVIDRSSTHNVRNREQAWMDRDGANLIFCVRCLEEDATKVRQAVTIKQGRALCYPHTRSLTERQQ